MLLGEPRRTPREAASAVVVARTAFVDAATTGRWSAAARRMNSFDGAGAGGASARMRRFRQHAGPAVDTTRVDLPPIVPSPSHRSATPRQTLPAEYEVDLCARVLRQWRGRALATRPVPAATRRIAPRVTFARRRCLRALPGIVNTRTRMSVDCTPTWKTEAAAGEGCRTLDCSTRRCPCGRTEDTFAAFPCADADCRL
jgi:hypothetical protein